jgi:hypothetical protein
LTFIIFVHNLRPKLINQIDPSIDTEVLEAFRLFDKNKVRKKGNHISMTSSKLPATKLKARQIADIIKTTP